MKKTLRVLASIFFATLVGLTASGFLYKPENSIPEGYPGGYVAANGVRLRVLQQGQGPDVLLIHGTPGSLEDFAPLMEILAVNHRVTVYDRPGHGFSAGMNFPYTLQHNAETAIALIRTLGLKDVVVVGHSYGGNTALVMALERPPEVKSYVVVGAVPYQIDKADPLYHLIAIPGLGTGVAQLLGPLLGPRKIREGLTKSFEPNTDLIPPGYVDLRIRLWSRPMVARARAKEILNLPSTLTGIVPRYKDITAPVFLVEGAVEKYVNDVKRLHEEIKGSDFTQLPFTGHQVPVVRPQELTAVIERASSAK